MRYFYNYGVRLSCRFPLSMAVQARLKYAGSGVTADVADRVPLSGQKTSFNEFSGKVANFSTRRRFYVNGIINATTPRNFIVGVTAPFDQINEEDAKCTVSADLRSARCVVNSEQFS